MSSPFPAPRPPRVLGIIAFVAGVIEAGIGGWIATHDPSTTFTELVVGTLVAGPGTLALLLGGAAALGPRHRLALPAAVVALVTACAPLLVALGAVLPSA